MKVPEQYRLKNHAILGSDSSYGNNGFFIIPHHRIIDYFYNVQASDGMGWEHVSITLTKKENIGKVRIKKVERCPTWEEMCYIKNLIWGEDLTVMQLHPPKSEYVNMHEYCLHLWKPVGVEINLPDSLMVGLPNSDKNVQGSDTTKADKNY
jgi:hypothetical protein